MRVANKYIERVMPAQLVPQGLEDKQIAMGAGGVIATGMAYGDGVPSELNARELRDWRESNVWIFSAVSQRRSGANADWVIAPDDPALPYDEGAIEEITNVLLNPQQEWGLSTNFGGVVEPFVDDILCLDNGVLRPQYDKRGAVVGLEFLDGAKLEPNAKWKVGAPKSMPRYFFDKNTDGLGIPIFQDDLIVAQGNPLTYRLDGLAPLRVLRRILLAEYDTFKSIHILQKNRTPAGLLKMPNASKQAVEAVKEMFLNELAGKSGIGFMNIPAESEFIELGSINLAEQGAFAFYDMLIRAIATAFRTTTLNLNWLQDVNRATAQEQSNLTDDGMVALLKLVQSSLTQGVVRKHPRSANLSFYYTKLMVRDEALAVSTIREMSGNYVNWASVNQMLVAQGLPPITGRPAKEQMFYDYPTIQVSTGQYAPIPIAAQLPQYQTAEEQQAAKLENIEAVQGSKDDPAKDDNAPEGDAPKGGNALPPPQPIAQAALRREQREYALAAKRLEWMARRTTSSGYRPKAAPVDDIRSAEETMYDELDRIYAEQLASAKS